jgi:hypothetical protein
MGTLALSVRVPCQAAAAGFPATFGHALTIYSATEAFSGAMLTFTPRMLLLQLSYFAAWPLALLFRCFVFQLSLLQELANGGLCWSELRGGWLKDQATGGLSVTLLLQVGCP